MDHDQPPRAPEWAAADFPGFTDEQIIAGLTVPACWPTDPPEPTEPDE